MWQAKLQRVTGVTIRLDPPFMIEVSMRVRVERTFLTTASGTRVIDDRAEAVVIESESLSNAILAFISNDNARLLGSITEADGRGAATAWKNRVYVLAAEAAPD